MTRTDRPTTPSLTISKLQALFTELYGRTPAIYRAPGRNRGLMMGCSSPHPHGQIWATSTIPNEPLREQIALAEYRKQHGTCLLCDYIGLEESSRERLV